VGNVLVRLHADACLIALPFRHNGVHDPLALRTQARPVHIPAFAMLTLKFARFGVFVVAMLVLVLFELGGVGTEDFGFRVSDFASFGFQISGFGLQFSG